MGQGVSFEEKLKDSTSSIAKKHADIDALVDEINEEGDRLIALIHQRKYTDREGICNRLAYQYVDTLSDFFPMQTLSDVRYRLGIVPENTPELESNKKQVCLDIVNFYIRKINLITTIQAELPNCKNMEREIYDQLNLKLQEDNLSDEEWLEVYEEMKDFNRDIRERYKLFQDQIEKIRLARTSKELDSVAKKTNNILAKTGAICKNYKHSLLPYAQKRTSPHKIDRDFAALQGGDVRVLKNRNDPGVLEDVFGENIVNADVFGENIVNADVFGENIVNRRESVRELRDRKKREIPALSPLSSAENSPVNSPVMQPKILTTQRFLDKPVYNSTRNSRNPRNSVQYAQVMQAPKRTLYQASATSPRRASAPATVAVRRPLQPEVMPASRRSLRKVPAPRQSVASVPRPLQAEVVTAPRRNLYQVPVPRKRSVVSVASVPQPLQVEVVEAPRSSIYRVPAVSVASVPQPLQAEVVEAPRSSIYRVPVASVPQPLQAEVVEAPRSSIYRVPVASVPQQDPLSRRSVRYAQEMSAPQRVLRRVPSEVSVPVAEVKRSVPVAEVKRSVHYAQEMPAPQRVLRRVPSVPVAAPVVSVASVPIAAPVVAPVKTAADDQYLVPFLPVVEPTPVSSAVPIIEEPVSGTTEQRIPLRQFPEAPKMKNGKKPRSNPKAYFVRVFEPYLAKSSGEINVVFGEMVTYLGSSKNGWARIRKDSGNVGYVPVNVLSM